MYETIAKDLNYTSRSDKLKNESSNGEFTSRITNVQSTIRTAIDYLIEH